MLLTYKHTCGLYNLPMQHPERFMKIQKTMAAIKHALGERAIEYRIQTDPSFVEKRNEKLRKNAQLSGLRESIKVNEKKNKNVINHPIIESQRKINKERKLHFMESNRRMPVITTILQEMMSI